MTLELIQTLYAYSEWANRRVLNNAANLTPAQLTQPGPASFDSIHATLVHLVSAQWIWLSRWQGTSPTATFAAADFPDLAAVRARWAQIEQDTRQFVAGLDEVALHKDINYTNTKGQAFAYPLWQLMLQQANHATQHRSEIAMILTELGYSPGWLDFIKYLDETNA